MAPSDKSVRQGILRRRALFISSVTALSGCSPTPTAQAPPTKPSVPPVVQVKPTPSVVPSAQPSVSPQPAPAPKPLAGLPSLEIPADADEVTKARFEKLRQNVLERHALLDTMEQQLPRDCSIVEDSCASRWQEYAGRLVQLGRRPKRVGFCRHGSSFGRIYEQRLSDHNAFFAKRHRGMIASIDELVQSYGEEGERRWKAHMMTARAAFPQVCLRYRCREW